MPTISFNDPLLSQSDRTDCLPTCVEVAVHFVQEICLTDKTNGAIIYFTKLKK